MREILFRGKNVSSEKWAHGYLFKIWEKAYICWGTVNGVPDMKEVNPSTVCQYTGLTDRNSKKIYEGDILKYPSWLKNRRIKNDVCVCRWNCSDDVTDMQGFGMFVEDELLHTDEWDEFEVIGNIYDNPELLETRY